jgi:HEAT repeat protein
MLEHESPDIRSNALVHVGAVPRANDAYIRSLRAALRSPGVSGHASAIKALGSLEPLDLTLPLVIESLQYGTAHSRTTAIQVLRDHPEIADRSFDPIIACLQQEQDATIRMVCIYALAELGQGREEAVLAIIPYLDTEPRDVGVAAALSLANLGATAEPALPALKATARSGRETVARVAQQAITIIQTAIDEHN